MEKLGLNLSGFLIQLFNFLIVFFVLAKFVFPKVLNALEKRKEKIEDGLRLSEKVKEELANIEQKNKEILNKAMQEAAHITKEAKDKAEVSRKEIISQAEKEAKSIIEKANEEIKAKEKAALKEITNQAIELSIIAAEKILNEKISTANQDEIIQQSLKEFDKVYG